MTLEPLVDISLVADIARQAEQTVRIQRGSTLGIRVRICNAGRAAGLAATNATFCWRRPGMDGWWTKPAEVDGGGGAVTAVWTPDMDDGAPRYAWALSVGGGFGGAPLAYVARGDIEILLSPGAVPNELPLPAKVIDFSAVEVRNAPWPDAPAIRALARDIDTGDGTLRATRGALETLLERLAAFGLGLALLLCGAPLDAAPIEWQDVPPTTPVEVACLTNTAAGAGIDAATVTNIATDVSAAATNAVLILADAHIAAATNAIPAGIGAQTATNIAADVSASATNALAGSVAAQIAAATNAIPAGVDAQTVTNIARAAASDRVAKAGDTMTGNLRLSSRGGWFDPSVELDAGVGNVTVRTRKLDPSRLWLANYNGDGIEVVDGETGMDYRVLKFPARSGTLALDPSSPYADPAPWTLSYAMEPAQTAADTYVVTNGDSASTWTKDVVYQDALLSVNIQDRPEPYAYAAPTGTWTIVEDADGAASGIEQDGTGARLLSSKAASGTVVAQYSTPSNGEQTVAVWLSQSQGKPVKVGGDYDLPGSPRHAWQTNLLSRLAAIDYAQTDTYAHAYGGGDYGPEYIARALSPYNDYGDTLALPTARNPAFFWPALGASLAPCSVVRTDIGVMDGCAYKVSPALFISPHWAVVIGHWNYAPTAVVCTNYEAGTFVTRKPTQRRVKGNGSQLALVRYSQPVPEQCIGRLITQAELAKVSPSLLSKACGFSLTQHGTVHPFPLYPWDAEGWPRGVPPGGPAWTATESAAATNACHSPHGGDSGHAIGIATPSAKVVWLTIHQTQYGGPWLYDPDNLAWIESVLAGDNEAPSYWTAAELMEGE